MTLSTLPDNYGDIHAAIVALLEDARRAAARSVNALMTAGYWEIGRRIVEAEQGGQERAEYGERLIQRLADDLTARFGRGFGVVNLSQMRRFYLAWPIEQIFQTASEKSNAETLQAPSAISPAPDLATLARRFPLPWSAYVRLLSVKNEQARAFYEAEALRCGWSVRQLDRQVNSQFYERVALSRNKAAMLEKGEKALPGDAMTPEEAIKDPFVLEFLDLKIGKFGYADAGQMHLYLNYAREHWMKPGENPPIGLILCAGKGAAEAHYALDNLPNKVLAAEYRTVLPDEHLLAEELERSRRELEARRLGAQREVGE